MKNRIIIIFALYTMALMISCTMGGMKKTNSGIEYNFFTDKEGRKPKKGDCLNCNITYKTQADSVLGERMQYRFILLGDSTDGSLDEGIAMMSPGDSAIFLISVDSIFTKAGQEMPEVFKKGDKMKFYVKFNDYVDEKTETRDIAAYLSKKQITAAPTPTGLIYTEIKAGTGTKPVDGDTVYVHYVGKFLNDTIFDKSESIEKPISFPLGFGFVIPGWEETLKLMSAGSQAHVVIPSRLAYGERGNYGIPPFTTLTFEMELVKVVKGQPVPDSVKVASTTGISQ